MKDLRIVIVSWNVEKHLERCLRSLAAACEGLEWEAVVVDNASRDWSVKVADQSRSNDAYLRFRIIANADNRGFAKACNQGIAGFDSRYVLLLNPDTECPPGSLMDLVKAADSHPRAGIIGPKLTNTDGSLQHSVRRFPTVLDQSGILLKLHHIFPRLFRNYFFPLTKGEYKGVVDQVMGACFLIRRSLIKDIGGLDERYFIWFEEVDYCKQAIQRGWEVVYEPSVYVIHHGGTSFAQVMSTTRQRMFNESLVKYFAKWHYGWKTSAIKIISKLSLLLTKLIDIRNEPSSQWIYWFLGIIAIETLSLVSVFNPVLRGLVTIVAGIAIYFLARKKPELGLAVLLFELAIGSKGALFKIPNGWEVDGGISIRIVMTIAFMIGWVVDIRTLDIRRWTSDVQRRNMVPWLVLGGLCVWGLVRGLWLKNQFVVQDANAWGFLILLLPVLDIASHRGESLIRHSGQALYAALLWLPIKTLALLYVWSHGIKSLSQPLYFWVRRTGIGEVTLVTGNLFRIFLQSQVYAISGFLISLSTTRTRLALLILSSVSILIGLSRSLWIGLFVGLLVLGIILWKEVGRNDVLVFISRIVVGFIAASVLIFAVVALPFPKIETGSLSSLFKSRGSVTDAAAASRWNLLPVLVNKIKQAPILGSGFGATVTYETRDPRILAKNQKGGYTTYAFEWGWLDHWIKFGILGIPVMLWLLISLTTRLWKLSEPFWIRAGFVSSLVALATLHVFTPYLNHPLGFGFLLAAEGFIAASKVKKSVE